MTDIERDKYVRLMSEVEELEDGIHALERSLAASGNDAAPDRVHELEELRDRLADRMRELARVTNGCSRPRASE